MANSKPVRTNKAEAEVSRKLNQFYDNLASSQQPSCKRPGTREHPIIVRAKDEHRAGAIYRYVLYTVLEKGANALLTRGNKVQTNIEGLDNFGIPDPVKLDAVGRAKIWKITADIATQVKDGEWFTLADSPSTLYFLQERRVAGPLSPATLSLRITSVYDKNSKKTETIDKAMQEILSEIFASEEEWDKLYQEGKAI